MNTSTTLIVLAGVGAAAFLYYRSQQAQAAALAAAQGAPGPSTFTKLENTVKKDFKALPNVIGKVGGQVLQIAAPVTNKISSTVGTAGHSTYDTVKSAFSAPVNLVKGIF